MNLSSLPLIIESLEKNCTEENYHKFLDISSLHSDTKLIQEDISSLQNKDFEYKDKIKDLITQEDGFLFTPDILTPLNPINTNFLKKANQHRGGWYSTMQHMYDNEYFDLEAETFLVDCVEGQFVWHKHPPIEKPWVGISHLTPNTPSIHAICHIDLLLENQNFKQSLKNCKGLVFLSEYMKNYVDIKLNRSVKSFFIKHPVGNDIKQFNLTEFLKNQNKKVVFLGKQMRRVSSIYLLKTNFPKAWMPGSDKKDEMLKLIKSEMKMLGKEPFRDFNPNLVEFLYAKTWKEYDDIITSNIMLLDFYDASANNSVLELMRSRTPFFCRRLAATEEYLGQDYPMFFNNLEFVQLLLNNNEYIRDLYQRTHEFLLNIDMSDLDHEVFSRKLLRIIQ